MMILYHFRSLDHRWLVRNGVTRFTTNVYFLIYQGKVALKVAQNEYTFRKHNMSKSLVFYLENYRLSLTLSLFHKLIC